MDSASQESSVSALVQGGGMRRSQPPPHSGFSVSGSGLSLLQIHLIPAAHELFPRLPKSLSDHSQPPLGSPSVSVSVTVFLLPVTAVV